MPSRLVVAALILGLGLGLVTPATADDVIPGHQIDRPLDGAVIAGALGLGLGLSLLPVRTDRGIWRRELFGGVDRSVHARFSPRAAQISDATLAATVAAPLAYLTGGTIDDADGDRLVIYGEALAINLALFQGAKRLVQRPRPYLYSTSPGVARYAESQGADAYQSFYSAHAATAFCAATAGAYLAGATSASRGVRQLAWASGFGAAAAVANLRVRAGKHFYSDVLIGGLVGVAIGYAVPALHADARPYVPDARDLGAAVAGLIGGGLLSQLLPLERALDDAPGARQALAQRPRWSRALRSLHLGPVPIPDGAGVGVAGSL
jgi:membrane-associated phospholipid phosphatase